uniref:SHOCT domain-containing protein n=1 Tax=uncultured Flavonifractor sp. TaxID=1193534 RepID=UPI002617D91E|nr:SHOCT domain-containing protein [uncultured Flavonifractor sp.]
MSRRKVTYRPSKAGSVMGGVVGCVFVLIGLFVIIPQFSMAGGFALLFGIAWTAIAAIMTIVNFYQGFGKKYMGPEIHIEEDGVSADQSKGTPQQRLEQLQSLYDRRLITQEEYEQKRQEILKEL